MDDASERALPSGFYSLLFFLGCADLAFANRIDRMNFRWGQLLLLGGLLFSARSIIAFLRESGERRRTLVRVLSAWTLFFTVYGVAALSSAHAKAGLVKLAWAVVNIGGAYLLLVVVPRRRQAVLDGIAVGAALVSAVIWLDTVVMYWTDLYGPLIGFAQSGYTFRGIQPLRAHAFYYEPSFAGAMLAFVTPLLFVATETMPRWTRVALPALTTSAAVIVGSRTGILALAFSLGLCAMWSAARRNGVALRRLGATLALVAASLAVFSLAPRARVYMAYLTGPLGFGASAERIVSFAGEHATLEARTSEGSRVASMIAGLRMWRERPLLGWGANSGARRAVGGPEDDRSLHTGAPNTWVEVLVESGGLGFACFVLALGVTLWAAWRARPRNELWGFLVAACAAHLVVNLNMTQTFPRLDYWLLFFGLVRAALPDTVSAAQVLPFPRAAAPDGAAAITRRGVGTK